MYTDDSPLVIAFRDDAQAYCDFIDAWCSGAVAEPYSRLLSLLSKLASSGVALPFAFADKEVAEVDQVDDARWQALVAGISDAVYAACSVLVAEHVNDNEALTGAIMLYNDLADIYRDLREGLDLYAFGDRDHVAEAIWQWRFGYEHHWGPHLFRALATVHEIRFQLLFD